MRGARPKSDAISRRTGPPRQAADIVAHAETLSQGIRKPDAVLANPVMNECWDLIVSGGRQYTEADIPGLRQMCYWYAVFEQCVQNTVMPDGRIITKVARTVEGKADPATAKQHPDLKTAQQAANMFRQLAGEYGISPLARQRLGLLDAMTRSTHADLVAKTKELFERFEARDGVSD